MLRLVINKILLYYKSYTAHKLLIFMSGNLRREISLLLDKYSRFALAIAFSYIFTTLNLLSNHAFFFENKSFIIITADLENILTLN